MKFLLDLVISANMNMLRVWGGGYFLSEEIFEYADQQGLMIWQEFPYACGLYPADKDFLALTNEEV